MRELFEFGEAIVLLGAASFSFLAWRRLANQRPGALFWLVAAVGTFVLAADELSGTHERVGHALYRNGFREPAGVNHLDDLILMALATVGVSVIVWGWPELRREKTIFLPFAVGGLLFASAVLWDAFASTKGSASWWFEESLELAGGILMAAAFGRRWLTAGLVSLRPGKIRGGTGALASRSVR